MLYILILYVVLSVLWHGIAEFQSLSKQIKSLSTAPVFCMNCMFNAWWIEFRLYDKQLAHVYLLNLSWCLSSHTQCSWQRLSNNYLNAMLSIHITLQLVTKVTSHNFHATDDQRAIIQWPFSKTVTYFCNAVLCSRLLYVYYVFVRMHIQLSNCVIKNRPWGPLGYTCTVKTQQIGDEDGPWHPPRVWC